VPRVRPRPQRAITLLCLALVAILTTPAAPAAGQGRWERQPDDPISVARRQRDRVHGRIETQAERLSRLRASSKALTVRLRRTADRLDDLAASLEELRDEVAAARAELATAEAERDGLIEEVSLLDWNLGLLTEQADELAADLGDRRRALGARLAEAYRTTQTDLWEQVLDARSLMDVVVEEAGLLSLADHDRAMADGIARDQAALDVRRRDIRQLRWETDQLREAVALYADEIEADRDRLLAAEKRLEERERDTEALRAEQQEQFRKLARTRVQVQQLLARQRAQAERLSKRIHTLLERERHRGRLPSAYNGTLRWPVIGRVSQEFGCTGFALEPPYRDCAHFHRGIDLVRGWGAPIVAAGDGVILFVGYDPDVPRSEASWQVVIGHSQRLLTVYGHMVPNAPSGIVEGARVREGQTIGWIGNTGNSTGAHLHWGVWLSDNPVNPRYFL
jgi:murein DD-endopeptidase MepM/ murein hydrolase activator NlpD